MADIVVDDPLSGVRKVIDVRNGVPDQGMQLSDKPRRDQRPDAVQPTDTMPRTIMSRGLLMGQRRLIIRHEQEDYRLQVTATGKLILTK